MNEPPNIQSLKDVSLVIATYNEEESIKYVLDELQKFNLGEIIIVDGNSTDNTKAVAEAYGIKGIRCEDPARLDDSIREMIEYPGPVIFDCLVEKHENCFPMIPSGKAHNEMILGEQTEENSISDDGAVLV